MKWFMTLLFSVLVAVLVALPSQVSAASITETSAAIGKDCVASGDYSTAMGWQTSASSVASTALGFHTSASNSASIAMGNYTNAEGEYSTAMGNYTSAEGFCSTAMGNYTTAKYSTSIAMGSYTTANAHFSTVIGRGKSSGIRLINNVVSSFMVGYMSSETDTEPEFFVKEGAVGFGTKTPTEQITITTPSNTDTKILFTETTAPAVSLFYEGSAGSGTSNKFHLRSEISGSESNIMTWKLNGNVGIGTSSPNYLLEVGGSAGKPGGGSWTNSSDERLKDVMDEYTLGLDEIALLKPVIFHYKEDNARNLPTDEEYIGFIAQDVEEVFPEAVSEGPDGYLDFNMHPVNVAVINAIKELKKENDFLKAENAMLKKDIEKIKVILGI